MKRNLTVLCLVAAVLALGSCGRNAGKKAGENQTDSLQVDSVKVDSVAVEKMSEKLAKLADEPEFDIVTTLGTIRIKLYSKTPKHRLNFARLALDGFYDGILFHRVINGFMIQGGDPLTKDEANAEMFGTGGPGYTVPAEILPEYYHKKGALAAARRGNAANPYKESSGSQFYLVQDEQTCYQLDGEYTVFGETVSGLDIIDKIAAVDVDLRDCPVVPVKIITIKLAE